MNNQAKINLNRLLIVVIVIIILLIITSYIRSYKESELVRQTTIRVESEMRFKQLAVDIVVLKNKADSLKNKNTELENIIIYQKNNPALIIKKYETISVNIDNLDAIQSIQLFSNNITKFNNNRERYELYRFNKRR